MVGGDRTLPEVYLLDERCLIFLEQFHLAWSRTLELHSTNGELLPPTQHPLVQAIEAAAFQTHSRRYMKAVPFSATI